MRISKLAYVGSVLVLNFFYGCNFNDSNFGSAPNPVAADQSLGGDGTVVTIAPEVEILPCAANEVSFEPSDDMRLAFSATPSGETESVSIKTTKPCLWVLKKDASWLDFASLAQGSGSGKVNFTVSANGVLAARDASIDLYSSGGSTILGSRKVIQAGFVPGNQAPQVSAGSARSVQLGTPFQLTGTAVDDGLPNPPGMMTTTWSKTSGPAVTFGDASDLTTSVVFSSAGNYTFQLEAIDGKPEQGGLSSTASVNIVVTSPPQNKAPVVDAGASQTVILGQSYGLKGIVSDDGLPANSRLINKWTVSSKPANASASFDNASSLNARVTFSAVGNYVLQLSSNDGEKIGTATVNFNVIPVIPDNKAPSVSAGSLAPVQLPASGQLRGSVTDDGLPAGARLTIGWTKLSGPGDVVFGDASKPQTVVSFSAAGTYVLQLEANDSQLSGRSTVTVSVLEIQNLPPQVDAGVSKTVTLSDQGSAGVQLNGSASDDGLPNNTLTTTWSMLSGPASVSLGSRSSLATSATFTKEGEYVMKLVASDGELESFSTVKVTVRPAPPATAKICSVNLVSVSPIYVDSMGVQSFTVGATVTNSSTNGMVCAFTIASQQAGWLSVERGMITLPAPTSGTSRSAQVKYKVTPNTSSQDRYGQIWVSEPSLAGISKIRIEQAADHSTCTPSMESCGTEVVTQPLAAFNCGIGDGSCAGVGFELSNFRTGSDGKSKRDDLDFYSQYFYNDPVSFIIKTKDGMPTPVDRMMGVDIATYTHPDHIIISYKLAGPNQEFHPIINTCTLKTDSDGGPLELFSIRIKIRKDKVEVRPPASERPCNDTIQQKRTVIPQGTVALKFEYPDTVSKNYIQVTGLCDFDLAPGHIAAPDGSNMAPVFAQDGRYRSPISGKSCACVSHGKKPEQGMRWFVEGKKWPFKIGCGR